MEAAEIAGKTDRRDEILAAATTVMARMGFERMRLRDVATEAGVSIGLLQHYFETREQLGREAFSSICGERAACFAEAAIGTGSAWERVERCLRYALVTPNLVERSRVWVELCAASSRDDGLRQQAARVQAAWRAPLLAAILSGAASGEFNPVVSPEAATDTILALIDGAEVRSLIEDEPEGVGRRVFETAIVVTRSIVGAA
jgi:AcrR family transcriptional regulator